MRDNTSTINILRTAMTITMIPAMTITMMLNDLSAFYDIYNASIKEILNQHSNEGISLI